MRRPDTPRRTDPAPLLQRAAQALQAGDLTAAERAARTALKAAPNHPGALHLLALTAKRAGYRDAALDLFRKATQAAPRYAEAWTNLGQLLIERAEPGEAREAFAKALAARPHFLPAELGLADALKAAGDPVAARQTLDQAMQDHPEAPAPAFALANLHQEQGELTAAVAAYGETLARQAQHTGALSNRAAANLKRGEAAAALADAEAYLATGTRSANVVAYKVLALQHLDRIDEARALDDPETMVFAERPNLPADFGARLAAAIRAHPDLTDEWDPAKRAARGGQVVPDLSRHPTPESEAFLAQIRATVDALRERLPDVPGHPLFGAKPAGYRVICWANILAPGGHQAAHIHNYGWMSGVYYPSLPPSLGPDSQAGWIAFGEPGYGLPPAPTTPVRAFMPEAGGMFLFPSYSWHRTLPLAAAEERVSVAFDIVPN